MKAIKYFELKRCIQKLNDLSINNYPPQNYTQLLKQLTKFCTFKTITIEDGFILYRSRVNEKGGLFEHVDELKYPNSNYVKRKGRLNDIGQSILYASSSLLGTIIESRPNINYIVTISKIKQKNDTLVYFMPIGFESHKFSTTPANKCESIVVNYLNQELIKIVTTDEAYNSTIAISNHFMNLKLASRLDIEIIKSRPLASSIGLIYPSVQSKLVSNKTTQNIAMNPSLFDGNYIIFEVDTYCMILHPDALILNPLNNAVIFNDGSLNWKFTFSEMIDRASKGLNLHGHHDERLKKVIF